MSIGLHGGNFAGLRNADFMKDFPTLQAASASYVMASYTNNMVDFHYNPTTKQTAVMHVNNSVSPRQGSITILDENLGVVKIVDTVINDILGTSIDMQPGTVLLDNSGHVFFTTSYGSYNVYKIRWNATTPSILWQVRHTIDNAKSTKPTLDANEQYVYFAGYTDAAVVVKVDNATGQIVNNSVTTTATGFSEMVIFGNYLFVCSGVYTAGAETSIWKVNLSDLAKVQHYTLDTNGEDYVIYASADESYLYFLVSSGNSRKILIMNPTDMSVVAVKSTSAQLPAVMQDGVLLTSSGFLQTHKYSGGEIISTSFEMPADVISAIGNVGKNEFNFYKYPYVTRRKLSI